MDYLELSLKMLKKKAKNYIKKLNRVLLMICFLAMKVEKISKTSISVYT